MLELLSRAILPVLSLSNAIKDWCRIAHQLAESPRQRVRQTVRVYDFKLTLMRLRGNDGSNELSGLMSKMPEARKHHRQTMFISRRDDFFITH